MNFKNKILYFFHSDVDRQEQALFIALTITLSISIYLIYAHWYRSTLILVYSKIFFVIFNLICLYLLMYKKISIEKLSRTFMMVLFIFLSFDISLTVSKLEAVLLFIFYPIAALMICRKKRALVIISFFLLFNSLFYILGPTELQYTLFEAFDALVGVFVFVTLIGFYINSYDNNQIKLDLTNKQLTQQHDLLENIFNKAPLFYSSFNEDGSLNYISNYELKLMRKLREEMIGKHFKELYQTAPKVILNLSLLTSKNEHNFILDLYGRTFDFRCSRQFNKRRKYLGFSMIAFDITEQVKAEKELQNSEDKLSVITEIAFEAIIVTDDFSIIQANTKAYEIFGYDQLSDILDENITSFVTEGTVATMIENIKADVETPYLLRGIKKDGSTFPIQVKGRSIHYMGKTLRVSTIQSLDYIDKAKKEIAKLAQVVEQNSSIIMISNASGAIEYVNQAFVDKMGYSKEEMLGQNPSILSSGHHDESFYEGWKELVDAGNVWSKEMNNRTKEGDIVTVKNNISAIKDAQGTITHYISMQEDITQIKEQERMFFAQTKQAQMGEMLSMIAHQWRQPLSAISVIGAKMRFAVELDTIKSDDMRESLELIDEQVQFLSDTIDDFRNFFKPNKKVEVLPVQNLIKKSTSLILKQIELANITLIVDDSVNPEFSSHHNELVQVLLSLMKNSLDQMSHSKNSKKEIRISVQETKHECIISVCDSAGGIPKEIINDIFLPYFSTKDEKQGTGLGLHMCKTIVEDHCRGSIVAENHDYGVCFFITLPLH